MVSIPCPSAGDRSPFRRPAEPAAGLARSTTPATRPRRSRARRLASSFAFYVGQVLLLGGLFMVYRLGRSVADGRQDEALQNALNVWHFERLLDLPNESGIQRLALHSTDLLEWANRFYIGVHFPAAIAFLLWVLVFQRAHWPRVRNVIMLSTGVALVIHILYPLAPPRFLPAVSPDIPFVDTGVVIGPSAYAAPGAEAANQYAAMPSLHVGWAILEAWGVITILRWRARWLAIAHPVVTALVVVITANHYWLDGLIGGGLVYGAVLLTRPARWRRLTDVTLAPARRVRAVLSPRQPALPGIPGQAVPRPALVEPRPPGSLARVLPPPPATATVGPATATVGPAAATVGPIGPTAGQVAPDPGSRPPLSAPPVSAPRPGAEGAGRGEPETAGELTTAAGYDVSQGSSSAIPDRPGPVVS
ncbi:phosphatase PAP2 family protein [Frankia sp. CN6]|uniref:Phosphatase PAP2 family protein n=1 Tax=Frankia nepalensis TaxID=1836974 RepID=A0A937RIN4_9ACTN|nr:phosphatase PAP2 family protein [Frankia nepalensis]MBL7630912.1 phosphatase PAP2 family protein [Frankia nepalensis]